MRKKKGKLLAVSISGICAIFCIVTWLLGWFAPITALTPFFLMMSRPEISSISKNLMIGNFGAYFSTPAFLNITVSAWNSNQTVYGMNALCEQAKAGKTVYYSDLYTEDEKQQDPKKEDVSLYCLHAKDTKKRPYVLMLAGGGFSSVCTPFESLPVCASFHEMGYTAFALTYRTTGKFGLEMDPAILVEDIARAVEYITLHAEELNVDPNGYMIGGFSAGGIAISAWCDQTIGYTQYPSLPAPAAACFIYGLNDQMIDRMKVPSFIRYCNNDQYFAENDFLSYTSRLSAKSIPFDYKKVNCLHGFGLGVGTEAEGWTKEAEAFWKSVR